MRFLYLLMLIVSLGGMAVLDWRFRLYFFAAPLRAAAVLLVGVLFFLSWDLAGIGLGIFFRAETAIMTGVLLAPELPLEELFFLAFLCYLAMVLFLALRRRLQTGTFLPRPGATGSGCP